MLVPVDAVVEPVEDHEEHRDRNQRDDGRELLAVPVERAEDGLGDDPRHGGGAERGECSEEERLAEVPLGADHPGHQRCEDQDCFQALPKDDHRGVRHDGGCRFRAGAHRVLGVAQRDVERSARYRHLLARRVPLEKLRESLILVRSVPEEAFAPDEEVLRQPSETLLRAELEEGVRLEPGLPRPARTDPPRPHPRCGRASP